MMFDVFYVQKQVNIPYGKPSFHKSIFCQFNSFYGFFESDVVELFQSEVIIIHMQWLKLGNGSLFFF